METTGSLPETPVYKGKFDNAVDFVHSGDYIYIVILWSTSNFVSVMVG